MFGESQNRRAPTLKKNQVSILQIPMRSQEELLCMVIFETGLFLSLSVWKLLVDEQYKDVVLHI